jgi:hypothetical protein
MDRQPPFHVLGPTGVNVHWFIWNAMKKKRNLLRDLQKRRKKSVQKTWIYASSTKENITWLSQPIALRRK